MRHGELVALALLARRPRHAYDLNKEIETMRVRRWAKLGASTLYRVLDRLAERRLVAVKSERVGQRPARKVYTLNAKGREALKRYVTEGLRSRAPLYSDRIVAAVFAELAGPEVAAELDAAKSRLADSLASLGQMRGSEQLSPIGRVVVDFQFAAIAAERDALDALDANRRRQRKRARSN